MGAIVGLSHSPTRYKLMRAGKDSYVRCGADLIINGLGSNVEAEARCPICGKLITFNVHERHLRGLKPAGAWLYVIEIRDGTDKIMVQCNGTNIFDKEECLAKWTANYHGRAGAVYSLKHYLARCIEIRGGTWRPADSAC